MRTATAVKTDTPPIVLTKPDPATPAIAFGAAGGLVVKVGVAVAGEGFTWSFDEDRPVALPTLEVGRDYAIFMDPDGTPTARLAASLDDLADAIGGFHFAPGGAAAARAGGDDVPAIFGPSLWDLNFRPAAPDPRGMALVAGSPGDRNVAPFWADLYLLAQDHLAGTSRFGAAIADGGNNLPEKLEGKGSFKKLDYATAVAIAGHHGKSLPSYDEFRALAYGVTERTANSRVETAGLDAPRTSRFVFQATGNRWSWGHDGDPDEPRASRFGGGTWIVGVAGSRHANVATSWPEDSYVVYGARCRCDHLQLA